jgi:hypothetical protein
MVFMDENFTILANQVNNIKVDFLAKDSFFY